MSLHSKRNNCRLCLSNDVRLAVELQPVPVGEHYYNTPQEINEHRFPINIYQCMSCSAVQTLDDIDSQFLWDGYTYFSGQTKGILKHFEESSSLIIEKFKLDKKSKIFDIGSNDGSLLACFKRKGFPVFGVDPSDIVAGVANNSDIPTHVGLFSDDCIRNFPEDHQTADVITAFNVFAHSSNMQGMIRGVQKMLSPEGIFCFEVQYLGDISKKKLLGTIFHEHMIHYSLKSAKKFLELHEMRLLNFTRNSIQMGSIIFYAAHNSSQHKSSITDISFLERDEEINGISSLDWANDFTNYIKEQKQIIKNMRIEWLNSKPTVYGYGAARSGPTLAIQFGLENCINSIFDDHPSKSGKYGVFESLKVLPTNKLMEIKPDIVIILAWIHAGSIVKNNINFLTSGGRFLVLWPKVCEISIENYESWLLNFEKFK